MESNEIILKVQTLLAQAGAPDVEFFIAGGYARDTAYGKTPKDCDILVIQDDNNFWDDATSYSLAKEVAYQASAFFGFSTDLYQAYTQSDNPDDFNDRLFACVKLKDLNTGFTIDLLFSKYNSLGNALMHFDYNFNCFYIDRCSGVWPRKLPTELVQLKPVSEKRAAYIQAKWESYNEGASNRP